MWVILLSLYNSIFKQSLKYVFILNKWMFLHMKNNSKLRLKNALFFLSLSLFFFWLFRSLSKSLFWHYLYKTYKTYYVIPLLNKKKRSYWRLLCLQKAPQFGLTLYFQPLVLHLYALSTWNFSPFSTRPISYIADALSIPVPSTLVSMPRMPLFLHPRGI